MAGYEGMGQEEPAHTHSGVGGIQSGATSTMPNRPSCRLADSGLVARGRGPWTVGSAGLANGPAAPSDAPCRAMTQRTNHTGATSTAQAQDEGRTHVVDA